ncbi:MAG: VOC family protein [Immundisolibacterales bacterium]|nr:VOC family protein [Immundisolibacterales bacterium]
MLTSELAYVAAVTRDIDAAAAVFTNVLDLPRTDLPGPDGQDVPVFSVGRSALALFEPGDPGVDGTDRTGIHHFALAASDPAAVRDAAAAAGVGAGASRAALGGGEAFDLDPAETRGVLARLSPPLDLPPPSGWVERFDHIGISTNDCAGTEACFAGKLGYEVESRQSDVEVSIAVESFTSDKYGIVYHNRPPRRVGGGRVVFITIGDTELEVIEPLEFGPDAPDVQHGERGDTRQDMGTLARYVDRRGPGLHHVAFKVPDADDALRRAREAGCRMIDDRGRPGSRRAMIGFIHPAALGGILVHFDAREEI